jgi:hypothetical protein
VQAVAGRVRRLEQLGHHDRLRHHPESGEHRRDVREQDRPTGGGAQVHQRAGATQLEAAPEEQDQQPAEDGAEGRRAGPSPAAALGDAHQHSDDADRHAERAEHVEAPGGRGGPMGEGYGGGDHHDGGEGAGHPEEGVPVVGLGDPGRDRKSQRTSDAERCADAGHGRVAQMGGHHLADEADGDGDVPHREALQHAPREDRGEGVAEGADQ